MMSNDLALDAALTTNELFLNDVMFGLSRPNKELSSKWLYDHIGSALFEEITRLPEYYLTRVETDILRRYSDILASYVPPGGDLVELGSGASVKTRILLDEGRHFRAYAPIDISEDFLIETAINLRTMYPKLSVLPIVGDFLSDLKFPHTLGQRPMVGFFPGSTIGNMPDREARALLTRVRAWPGMERFIVGVDLVKDTQEMVAAYDDSQGKTAAFIGNILMRINRELGADFDPTAFAYQVEWNARECRIDMSLVSKRDQSVDLAGNRFHFARQEPVHVSASRKYRLEALSETFSNSGWTLKSTFTDPKEKFAICVLDKET